MSSDSSVPEAMPTVDPGTTSSDSRVDKEAIPARDPTGSVNGLEPDGGIVVAGPPDLPPKDQWSHIEQLIDKPKTLGDTWYIISSSWFSQWRRHCEHDDPQNDSAPGPVDNSSILKNGALADSIDAEKDIVLVPEEAWLCLFQWYGCETTALPRKVIAIDGSLEVEKNPYGFYLHLIDPKTTSDLTIPDLAPLVTLSRDATTAQLKSMVRTKFGLTTETEFQLWVLHHSPPLIHSVYISLSTLHDAELSHFSANDAPISDIFHAANHVAIELKDPTSGAYPSEESAASSASDASSTTSTSSAVTSSFHQLAASSASPLDSSQPNPNDEPGVLKPAEPDPSLVAGVCGLTNLGNTCFMNSAVQCLNNTPQLARWFLEGNCQKELNRDNPLGMKGEIAEAFGGLVEKLWGRTVASTKPRKLKDAIEHFNPNFIGYRQHDSQELLAFLLDGLHEDLNRILKKPYIEMTESDGTPDEEIAQRSWETYKARNDSIIVDLFQGQFKSRLTCNECSKVSVTFDPFMYLSLPLPIQKKKKIKVTYVPFDPTQKQVSMVVTLKTDASIERLRNEVAKTMHVEEASKLLTVQLFHGQFFKVYAPYEPVASIGGHDDICIYELPRSMSQKSMASEQEGGAEDDIIVFPLYCTTNREPETDTDEAAPLNPRPLQFGKPMLMAIAGKDAETPDALYTLITHHVERYAIVKLSEEVGEATEDQAPVTEDAAPLTQKPIHTAAAVTAAGGRRMQTMPNLFTMQVFSDLDEFIPLSSPIWSYNKRSVNLRERAERERDMREASQDDNAAMKESHQEEGSVAAMADSSTEEKKKEENDGDDEELVEDAAAAYESTLSDTMIVSPKRSPSPTKFVQHRSSRDQVLPKTVIRQGEGIMIEWRLTKAQQVFGRSKDGEGVDTSAWDDVEERGDPDTEEEAVPNKELTLDDCLNEFTREERLSDEDLWYCPSCEKHQRVTKKFDLWRLPEIMVVHLKRFSHSRTWRDKIDALIDFPLEGLDLTERVLSADPSLQGPEDRHVYDLYAVDNHFGGLGGGHYTAYAQNGATGDWYDFNDSRVEKMDEAESVKTKAAYLLFYKKRRPHAVNDPTLSNAAQGSLSSMPS